MGSAREVGVLRERPPRLSSGSLSGRKSLAVTLVSMVRPGSKRKVSNRYKDGSEVTPLTTAQRRAQIVEWYHEGKTFKQIGELLGISAQLAGRIYWKTIDSIPQRAVEQHRAAMIEQLAEATRVALEVMAKDHIAHSNGKVVMLPDESGEDRPVLDDSPRLDAGRTLVTALARLAKLVGADAPAKVEQAGSVAIEINGVDLKDLG